MTTEPSKTSGTYNSVVGGVSETLGNLVGSAGIAQSGKDQKASGDAEYKAAQAKEYVDATADRVTGKIDHVLGAVTGDTALEASGKIKHDAGVAKQALNE